MFKQATQTFHQILSNAWVYELFDPFEFDHSKKNLREALEYFNKLLSRHALSAFLDASDRCYLRNNGTGKTATITVHHADKIPPAGR